MGQSEISEIPQDRFKKRKALGPNPLSNRASDKVLLFVIHLTIIVYDHK